MVLIVQRKGNLPIIDRFTRIASRKDNVLHLASAEGFSALLAKHPADPVGNIALAAAIRTYNGRDSPDKLHLRLVGKRFKSC